MLSTPRHGFIIEWIDRLLAISQKVNSDAAVKFHHRCCRRKQRTEMDAAGAAGAAAKSKLLSSITDVRGLGRHVQESRANQVSHS
jgi:hypothetical protein